MKAKALRVRVPALFAVVLLAAAAHASPEGRVDEGPAVKPVDELNLCYGKYPVSMFRTVRTARTVGKGRLLVCLKSVYSEADEKLNAAGDYDSITGENEKMVNTLVAKYGWAGNHHAAVGIPYIWNNLSVGAADVDTNGLGNVFIFEKWNFIAESATVPALAADVWYFFPSGDTTKKLGTDDYAWRIGIEASKAWPGFNVHLNAAQTFTEGHLQDMFFGGAGILCSMNSRWQPGLEYNYAYRESKGKSHDLVPGVLWKPLKNLSVKAAAVVNLDSTMTYRDDVGAVLKVSYCF